MPNPSSQPSPTSLRRRVGAGCVHPVYRNGRITAWRGLASYKDPETGRQRRRSVSRRTRSEVEAALRALLRTLPKASPPSRRRPQQVGLPESSGPDTVLAFLNRWLTHRKRELRPTTYRTYVDELAHLIGELGDLPLATLTPLQIQQAISARLDQGLSTAKSVAMALRTLRMALKQAVLWGVLSNNPASLVRAPRTRPREMQVWTPGEARQFLEMARSDRLYPLFCLALSTGMRKGELLALAWEDVDLDRARLTVRHTFIRNIDGDWVLGEPKTRAGHRTLPLGDDVVQVLRDHQLEEERWFGTRGKAQPVFTRSSGARLDPSNVARIFHRLSREAGLPRIRVHDLRHTAASLLIRQGVSPKVVSDRLGHADVAFTLSVYTHLYDDQRQQAALPLSQLLGSDLGQTGRTEDLVTELQRLLALLTQGRG